MARVALIIVARDLADDGLAVACPGMLTGVRMMDAPRLRGQRSCSMIAHQHKAERRETAQILEAAAPGGVSDLSRRPCNTASGIASAHAARPFLGWTCLAVCFKRLFPPGGA